MRINSFMGRTLKLVGAVILNPVIFTGLLLWPAGTWSWWRAWVFIGVMLGVSLAVTAGIFVRRPDLLDERYRPPFQKGQPMADKIVVILLVLTFIGVVVFIPFDVFRFHLLGKPGPAVSVLGLAFVVGSGVVMYLGFRENAFAALVVRHQAERGQRVIDTGVYGAVRHPLYAAGILLFVGMPLWLESYAAALLASLPIAVLMVRVRVEEGLLRRELPGYEAYTTRVRHRLIPFVW